MTTDSAPSRWLVLAVLGAACASPVDDEPPRGDPEAPFAVVRSDFSSTAIALLDARGEVDTPAILDSGSRPLGLTTTLSGDVVLASFRPTDGVLNIIDRFMTDVVTRLDIASGSVLGQLRTQPSNTFASNPQDFVIVSDGSGWISRFEANRDPLAPPLNRGNDLVEFDPRQFVLTGRRIDLSILDETRVVDGRSVTILARPERIVRRGDTLVVGLARLSVDFDAAGPGRVALVDLDRLDVRWLELPSGLQNCGQVRAVPDRPTMVLVGCLGYAPSFEDAAARRPSAGVVWLEVDAGGEARVRDSFRPDTPAQPLAVSSVLPISADVFLGVETGRVGERGDRMWEIDAGRNEARELFRTARAFTLGRSAYEPVSGLLLVPDASEDGGVRRFRRVDDRFEPESIVRWTDGPLPARGIYRLR
jgi:hypothetical protein